MGVSLVNWLSSATVLHVRVSLTALYRRSAGVTRDLRFGVTTFGLGHFCSFLRRLCASRRIEARRCIPSCDSSRPAGKRRSIQGSLPLPDPAQSRRWQCLGRCSPNRTPLPDSTGWYPTMAKLRPPPLTTSSGGFLSSTELFPPPIHRSRGLRMNDRSMTRA